MIRPLLALTLALGLSACGAVANPSERPVVPTGAAAPANDGVPRLTAAELMAKQQAGEAVVVIDVRNAASYRTEHVKGAENVMTDAIASGSGAWAKDTTLVTYCTCVNEGSAAKAAQALQARGYAKVHALKEGLAGWKAAGGAVAADAAATSPTP